MLPYLIIFIIVAVLCIFDFAKIEKKWIYLLLAILLILFAGCRFNTGPDLVEYEDFYLETPPLREFLFHYSDLSYLPIEPGYLMLGSIFKTFGLSFSNFLLALTLGYVAIFFAVLPKYTKHILFAVLLYVYYCYFTGFSAIRQVFATAIFFYGIQYIKDKKFLKYFVCITIAVSFHYSAAILYFLYFVGNRKISFRAVIIILCSCVLIERLHLMAYAAEMLIRVISSSPAVQSLAGKYLEYLSEEATNIYSSIFFEWLLLIVLSALARKKLEIRVPYYDVFFNVLWIGLVVYTLFSSLGLGRIILYFKVSYVILVPYLVYLIKEKAPRYALFAAIAILVGLRCYIGILGDNDNGIEGRNRYIPYQFKLPGFN